MSGEPVTRPSVTVALPVFNGGAFLHDAIDSVLSQQGWDLHLVAVDDGSTDDSAELLASRARADERISVITMAHNRGVAIARNAAVRSRNDPLIAMIDQDDIWLPNRLDVGWSALCSDPTLAFTTGRVEFEEPDGPLPSWFRPDWLKGPQPGELFGTLLAWRHRAWNAVGDLDENLRLGDDTDWFVRARDLGIAHLMVPDVLLRRRVHTSNASRDTRQSTSELLSILRRRHR